MARKKIVIFIGGVASVISTAAYVAVCEKKKDVPLNNTSQPLLQNRNKISLEEAISKANILCKNIKTESGSPGLIVGVSVDGVNVFSKGFGYADVENQVACSPNTVLRIASISKSITAAVVGKLWQENRLDLDKPIEEYVPAYPIKEYNGEKVTITLRHLLSHLSGTRHYEKSLESNVNSVDRDVYKYPEAGMIAKKKDEFENKEYYIKEYYDSVEKSLSLFQNDELLVKPGTKFLYTTHGWTLISAAIERVMKQSFPVLMKAVFHELGMGNTYLDENRPLIYNRGKYYVRSEGRLFNAPYVDNSYKWAGGGFLSTVGDLLKFGNAMLYSYQRPDGYLSNNTMKMIWTSTKNTKSWDRDGKYGIGWGIVSSETNYPFCKTRPFYVSHTGGAIGASSVLLILPKNVEVSWNKSVHGTVVAILVNMQGVGLNRVALQIAEIFENVDFSN